MKRQIIVMRMSHATDFALCLESWGGHLRENGNDPIADICLDAAKSIRWHLENPEVLSSRRYISLTIDQL